MNIYIEVEGIMIQTVMCNEHLNQTNFNKRALQIIRDQSFPTSIVRFKGKMSLIEHKELLLKKMYNGPNGNVFRHLFSGFELYRFKIVTATIQT